MANKSHVFQLPESEVQITFLYLPSLELYVISDAKGFGQNWVRVTYYGKTYDTQLLIGENKDELTSSIARHLAEKIVKKKLVDTGNELVAVDEINVTFSISLRNKDPKIIRLIKEQFDKHLDS